MPCGRLPWFVFVLVMSLELRKILSHAAKCLCQALWSSSIRLTISAALRVLQTQSHPQLSGTSELFCSPLTLIELPSSARLPYFFFPVPNLRQKLPRQKPNCRLLICGRACCKLIARMFLSLERWCYKQIKKIQKKVTKRIKNQVNKRKSRLFDRKIPCTSLNIFVKTFKMKF